MRVLSFQSHVCHGHVGHQASLLPLMLHKFNVDPVHTTLLACHSGYAYHPGWRLSTEVLNDIWNGLKANGFTKEYTHLLIGYVGNEDCLNRIADIAAELHKTNPSLMFVLDPVMGDDGDLYVPRALVNIYRDRLCQIADLIVPNQFEAKLLTESKITTVESAFEVAAKIHSLGPKTVVITSCSVADEVDLYLIASDKTDGNDTQFFIRFPLVEGYFTGTGDMMSALCLIWITKYRTQGLNSIEVLAKACESSVSTTHNILMQTKKEITLRNSNFECEARFWELALTECHEFIISPKITYKRHFK